MADFVMPVEPVAIGGGAAPGYTWTVINEAGRLDANEAALMWQTETAEHFARKTRDLGLKGEMWQYTNGSGPVWMDIELTDG